MAESAQIIIGRPLRISELELDVASKKARLNASFRSLAQSFQDESRPTSLVKRYPAWALGAVASLFVVGKFVPKALLGKKWLWSLLLTGGLRLLRSKAPILFGLLAPVVTGLARTAWDKWRHRWGLLD